ncbi:hypothetical protein CEV32_2737 [Brucella rhizosphaerae]|uniref:Uncharacterized protein n=1 Tax=Brucella rhizosphaerae TaxID=571254 RepID=A0A256F025_9HYPH|nr:hypothetical protein CEV32_2737 [Brucella rhizosphaerae]
MGFNKIETLLQQTDARTALLQQQPHPKAIPFGTSADCPETAPAY